MTTIQEIINREQKELMIDMNSMGENEKRIVSYFDTLLLVNKELVEDMQDNTYNWDHYVPVGLVQAIDVNYSRELQQMGEIGSAAQITTPSAVSTSMSIGRLLHKERSALKALYQGSLSDNDAFSSFRIHIDCTDPMFLKKFYLIKVILGSRLLDEEANTIKSVTVYNGCIVQSVGGSMEAGSRVLTEGVSIMWDSTAEQDVLSQA